MTSPILLRFLTLATMLTVARISICSFFKFEATTIFAVASTTNTCSVFKIEEATIGEIQLAFRRHQLTSRELVNFYLHQIQTLNPLLRAVIEVNPDALAQADKADKGRKRKNPTTYSPTHGALHGIPVLIKDLINTKDMMNTTAGSFALLGSIVPRDAGVVKKLRKAGAVILGKASLSEWANVRSFEAPNGWCGRSGQGKNPYLLSADTGGSSSGSAIAVAANMASVSLGTETDGSIISPASANGVVGIKPSVGLTSRSGVIPISSRQDTVGPICRTVSDAVAVLDAIVGYDRRDSEATKIASGFIPTGGYMQYLKLDGLEGKRLGILRDYFDFPNDPSISTKFENHLDLLRRSGAIIIDNLTIGSASLITNYEMVALLAEFKLNLNNYLSQLTSSTVRVRTLSDVIAFNENNPIEEKLSDYGQGIFLLSENTTGIGAAEKGAIQEMKILSQNGLEKLMKLEKLDAIVTPNDNASSVLAVGGYPAISVPAGYGQDGAPFGICFGGLLGSEPKLIEIAFAFEQATMVRIPPPHSVVNAYMI